MSDENAIKLAKEYLELQFQRGELADLVGMLNHVDYYDRVVIVLAELDDVLSQCPSVSTQLVEGRIIFTQSTGNRGITREDFDRNVQLYHDAFWAKYRSLRSH